MFYYECTYNMQLLERKCLCTEEAINEGLISIQEGVIGSFFKAIISIFTGILKKIGEIFSKLFGGGYTASSSYIASIPSAPEKDTEIEIEGYPFDKLESMDIAFDQSIHFSAKLPDELSEFESGRFYIRNDDDLINLDWLHVFHVHTASGNLIQMEGEEYRNALKEYLYGDTEAKSIKYKTSKANNAVKNYNSNIDKLKKYQKQIEDYIKQDIKALETCQSKWDSITKDNYDGKDFDKAKNNMQVYVRAIAKSYQISMSNLAISIQVWTQALNDELKQAKAVLTKANKHSE